ncbi:MAG: FAD-binding protein [Chitinophagaceae bacterium]|nr:FAD-binding protein [Chitinophagaceae bacterium]MCW5928113.1 FAD-binding protein [Chitinophagaceae bacterium]
MKRTTFLKTTATLAAGSVFGVNFSCGTNTKTPAKDIRTNWAGNYQYKAPEVYAPGSVDEVRELVKKLNKQKALGSTHCFNDIADSPQNQVSMEKLNRVVDIDKKAGIVTLEGGARYGQFAPELDKAGFALHNLASLPHISVAGACATGTHGSGVLNGNLSTEVRALELVTPAGDIITLDRDADGDRFNGAVVNLGALGIITRLVLDLVPAFEVKQYIFENLPLESLREHFNEIMSAGYSVSLFTDWQDKKVSQVWVKHKAEADTGNMDKAFFGATAAVKNMHPISSLSAENCTEQMGIAGPWYERLPHFKMGFTPSSGEELQSEFFVSKENAVDAILAIEKKAGDIFPHLFISEIRTIAGDDLWMSPCYKRDSVAIHFTWKQHTEEVLKLITMIEDELAPFHPRVHWGKLFTLKPAQLQSRYERYNDFLALAKDFDPQGKCRNAYLDRCFYNT